ncbi:MAG: hypothetical protein H7335_13085 [Massilia sp.]|nr:hypothetical protein [Massilia sp.]
MLALAPFILWRVYNRVQRLTVRQKSHLWRHWCGVTLLPVGLAVMGLMLLAKVAALGALCGGAAAGAILGAVALRRTGFERVDADYFYTPYAPIGLLVAMIFVARLLYRVFQMASAGVEKMSGMDGSPMTMLIMGVVAGYYLVYTGGLLRWRLAERALGPK